MLKLIEVKPIDINGNSVLGVKIANPESSSKTSSHIADSQKLGVTEGMNEKEALKKMS